MGVSAVVNPHYWNPAVKPLVHQIVIKGVPDITSFTSGMLTGAIQGSYYFGASTLNQLEHSSAVRVYQGPGQLPRSSTRPGARPAPTPGRP